MGTVLVLDGATGTELDRRGVDISLPLWSARAVFTAPEVLGEVHRDYLLAGADALTTCTFRTHARTLAKEPGDHRARDVTSQAVEIARKARDEHKPSAVVLGSVAPLEDCYRPDLAPDAQTCRDEHTEMIASLVDAGADFILIETMNNLAETRAAVDAARTLAPGKWIVSFCTRSQGPPGVLLSGEPLDDVLDELDDAFAVGVNCVAAPAVQPQVTLLRERLPPDARICAYANIGHADADGNWVSTDAVAPDRYAEYARGWIDAGATLVGGCCGTTPETIRAIANIGE